MINYTEFIAATISVSKILTNQKLTQIFNEFDMDNTGYITIQNIKEAMGKMGKRISQEEVEKIME